MAIMSKKATIGLVILVVLVVASAFLHVSYVYDGGNGTLLWNGDTAYLFLDLGSLGYRMTYLQYLACLIHEG